MEFENACSEVYYILEHLNPIDRAKIPESTIKFFRDNRSIFYKTNLDITRDISEQNITDETKAFIEILDKKYFKKNENIHIEKEIKEQIITQTNALTVIKKENKIVGWFKKILRKIGIDI